MAWVGWLCCAAGMGREWERGDSLLCVAGAGGLGKQQLVGQLELHAAVLVLDRLGLMDLNI